MMLAEISQEIEYALGKLVICTHNGPSLRVQAMSCNSSF